MFCTALVRQPWNEQIRQPDATSHATHAHGPLACSLADAAILDWVRSGESGWRLREVGDPV
jgi:hypothetical protein